MTPKRIQMSRQNPWRDANPDAVIVSRPSRWGNPFISTERKSSHDAVEAFRQQFVLRPELVAMVRKELGGKDLACWCALDSECHADVLLELSNPDLTATAAGPPMVWLPERAG